MLQPEKKTDYNTLIGFILITIVLLWFSNNQVKNNFNENNKSKISIPDTNNKSTNVKSSDNLSFDIINDSEIKVFKNYTTDLLEKQYFLENDLIKVSFTNLGGKINGIFIKNHKNFMREPLNLINKDSSDFNLAFFYENQKVETSKLYFVPSYEENSNIESLSMRFDVSEDKYIEFKYSLPRNSYNLDCQINIINLEDYIKKGSEFDYIVDISLPRLELNKKNELYNSGIYFFTKNDLNYLSTSKNEDNKIINNPDWVAMKYQYFSAVILTEKFPNNIFIKTKEINKSEKFLRQNTFKTKFIASGGNENINFTWYFVPNHLKTLKKINKNLENLVPLGWSLIGWINEYVVINIFYFFESMGLGYGLIIFLMALIIKIALFPFTYKSYVSMAKMRILKPQIDLINEKFKDPLKKQQETMSLYRKTGVSPLGGCIPIFFQMPILFALFQFFPAAIELRQKSFLWADDLSTYDSILDLGFNIPFYGDHVSLFTLLMTVSTMIQMRFSNMNTSNSQMPQLKYMMYFMPIVFLGVMNNYAAALSYYYFLANLMTFAQQKAASFMIDDSKLIAKMEENKLKSPKTKSKFQARLEKMIKDQQNLKKPK